MKTIFMSALALTLLCGTAGAIGIDWGVSALDFGTDSSPDLADSTSYGTDVGDFVLHLVFVDDGTQTEGGDGISRYNTFEVVDSGTLATAPEEQPGVVSGSAEVDTAGTYVMLLYNNYGGYWSLSGSSESQTALDPASYEVTTTMLENPTGFYEYTVTSGSQYQGAIVPEPSTAALALAGLALLFRRKRA